MYCYRVIEINDIIFMLRDMLLCYHKPSEFTIKIHYTFLMVTTGLYISVFYTLKLLIKEKWQKLKSKSGKNKVGKNQSKPF